MFCSKMNSNCSNLLDLRNLQEQVKKAFCYQRLFWPFTVWINCSSDLEIFANSRPSASNFKSFSRSLEQFFLTVGQNNFGNKIPYHIAMHCVTLMILQENELPQPLITWANLWCRSDFTVRRCSWSILLATNALEK